MSLSVEFVDADGDVDVFELCSASAWEEVGRWADGLDGLPKLKALIKSGEIKGTDELAEELNSAVRKNPPGEGVADLLKTLADNIGVGDPGESAAITD